MAGIEVLGDLRHVCHESGGCCQGHVAVLSTDEVDRVRELAGTVGVTVPVRDDALAQVDGVCAFLDASRLCRIHSTFGYDAKPKTCRQYPLVAVRTEAEVRVGIDPGCLSAWKSWETGPRVAPDNLVASRVTAPGAVRAFESQLLDRLGVQGLGVAEALSLLTGELCQEGRLPANFARRWLVHLKERRLDEVFGRAGTAPVFRDHLVTAARGWNAYPLQDLSKWPLLDPEQERWAIETTLRMVHLRFSAHLFQPAAVALITLAGAVAAAWADPTPDVWGPTFAAWTRAMRSDVLKAQLFPTAQSLQDIARGGE